MLNGRQLTLTVTNPSFDRPRTADISIHGGTPRTATAVTLAARDPHAHNTFENPHAVEPKEVSAHQFPPASVTRLTVALG